MSRRIGLLMLMLAFTGAACGGDGTSASTAAVQDGSSSDTDSGADADSDNGTPTPTATGGYLMLGDERIDFDSALCFLEEQDAFGGGKILAVAQAFGTNSDGVDMALDFTRFDEDSDFTGDDLKVTVGDVGSGEYTEYGGVLDLGSVTIEGRTVAGTGFNLTSFDFDDPAEFAASFEVNC